MTEKTREPGMYNPAAASQGGGRQRARRGPGRPPGRRQQQGQKKNYSIFWTHHAITKLE